MTLNRRTLIASTVAGGSALLASVKASATFVGDVELRGSIGRLERLPTRDIESAEDFSTSLRKWVDSDLNAAAERRATALFKQAGITKADDVPWETVVDLLDNDPVIMSLTHAWLDGQLLMWRRLQDTFHDDADRYLAEMEASDKQGPGALELNPKMHIPDYTRWEIHNQPGGYVGDPFAGHMYHYGTNNLYLHRNDQDGLYSAGAAACPVPDDKQVKRILDLGCSIGQMATALKDRFPEAEVWGIDVGGPMVRYAHMRAADLGNGTNFAQRLAEDTKFPDNHFDIVSANILFHEVSPRAARAILHETNRVLRPGGLFYPRERQFLSPKPKATAGARFRNWWNDRWNHEVWSLSYLALDHHAEMKAAGMEVRIGGLSGYEGPTGNLIGYKKV
ncbi:MAG: class I SAM-dependent methyltransferase [Alphaproteobacteria bacterium]|nr:class I SAM-dependent methyltransferase [Alphaproteobacteria bacterium]